MRLAPRAWLGPSLAACALVTACGDAEPSPAAPSASPQGSPEGPAEPAVPGLVRPVEGEDLMDHASAPTLPDGPADEARVWAGTFGDEAAARGLDYLNRSGEAHKPTVLGANGAGVALLDLGTDGDLDVAFGQGLGKLADVVTGPGADVEVFTNDGDGRFTRAAAPGLDGWWTGLAAGDVDGDGDADLVAAGYGGLELLVQDADGALARREAGLTPEEGERIVPGAERAKGRIPSWATSLALLDADRDGALDLYVGRYLELDPLDPPLGTLGEGALELPCWWKGHEVFCGPRGLVAQSDRMYRGTGSGDFTEVTDEWLPAVTPGYSLAVGAADADGDGDTDLYVANDSSPNFLFVNDGSGRFGEFGLTSGVALDPSGLPQAGMGVAFGDVDRDGTFDLAVTNFSEEPTELYFGASMGFRSQTHRYGLGQLTRRLLSWGVHLIDFDGDGHVELFTANGHVYPQADEPYTGTTYAQRDSLFELSGGRAREVRIEGERSLTALELGTRGSAVGDVDGDGAPDLVLTAVDAPAVLAINRVGEPRAHRLVVVCEGGAPPLEEGGPRTPRDGLGARVVLAPTPAAGEAPFGLMHEIQTSGSYQSSNAPAAYFGLGASATFDRLEVRWPSGRVDVVEGGAADRRLVVREGEGVVREEALR